MKRNLPSTTALQCFEAAARYSNFTRAAEELNLTQGAVSRQIRLLEEFLGQDLFLRRRRRVDPTPAGRALLAESGPLLTQLDSMVLRLQRFGAVAGSLSVGCYPTLGTRWLLPLSIAFSETYPDVTVNIVTYTANNDLDPDTIDIGIVQGDPPFRGMIADRLMPEGLAAVASPKLVPHPVDRPETLLDYRAIHVYSRPVSWQIWFRTLGHSLNDEPKGLFYSQFDAAIEAAIHGAGIAIVPKLLVERELADGRLGLAHPHIAWPRHTYYLVRPQKNIGDPRTTLFRDWLMSRLNDTAPR